MIYKYICLDCIRAKTGREAESLTVAEYSEVVGNTNFEVVRSSDDTAPVKCPVCGGSRTTKLLGLDSTYVRGYGYLDKRGVKNDMNLHLMTSGNDPYVKHRRQGDQAELVSKLRRQKRHIPRRRDVFFK